MASQVLASSNLSIEWLRGILASIMLCQTGTKTKIIKTVPTIPRYSCCNLARLFQNFLILDQLNFFIISVKPKAVKNNKSLLPAGVVEVGGNFNRGDVISVYFTKKEKIGVLQTDLKLHYLILTIQEQMVTCFIRI